MRHDAHWLNNAAINQIAVRKRNQFAVRNGELLQFFVLTSSTHYTSPVYNIDKEIHRQASHSIVALYNHLIST